MKGYTIDEIMACGYWYVPYIPMIVTPNEILRVGEVVSRCPHKSENDGANPSPASMEKNEIKKLLYKQNPKATLSYIRNGNAFYSSTVEDITKGRKSITFEIPIVDMGNADFFPEMEAKFLIRWIFI